MIEKRTIELFEAQAARNQSGKELLLRGIQEFFENAHVVFGEDGLTVESHSDALGDSFWPFPNDRGFCVDRALENFAHEVKERTVKYVANRLTKKQRQTLIEADSAFGEHYTVRAWHPKTIGILEDWGLVVSGYPRKNDGAWSQAPYHLTGLGIDVRRAIVDTEARKARERQEKASSK